MERVHDIGMGNVSADQEQDGHRLFLAEPSDDVRKLFLDVVPAALDDGKGKTLHRLLVIAHGSGGIGGGGGAPPSFSLSRSCWLRS